MTAPPEHPQQLKGTNPKENALSLSHFSGAGAASASAGDFHVGSQRQQQFTTKRIQSEYVLQLKVRCLRRCTVLWCVDRSLYWIV
jgi:hypothetical protein